MEQKPRLLVYSRREMIVLAILVALILVFGFTYGLHVGKKVQKPEAPHADLQSGTPLVNSVQDAAPNRQELDVEADQVDRAAQESAQQALKEEVTRTGLKLDKHRQMDLPEKSKAETKAENKPAELKSTKPVGQYTLQIGSYPAPAEAKARLKELKSKGLDLWMKSAEVPGKGKFYRIYAGGFSSKAKAEEAGKTFVIKDWIESFVVVPMPQN